ncbi:MAG: flagellar export protein FliJ [Deltaproteobacteria bacterium]|nr:flagellar export protein FliJ [Deltaproteobacteria bacterium]
MAFKFRYETLLSYRQHLKEKAGSELSRARQQLTKIRGSLENHKETLQQANQYLEADLKTKISSDELKNHSDYLAGLRGRIETEEQEVAEWKKVVREKLENLLTETKQYKVIEKLKERNFKKWSHQQHLLELKRMNEAAVIRYGKEFF